MKFLDLLRKLGVLRWGAKAGTYTSGKDAPAEFMMDDVFDANKDLARGGKDKAAKPPAPPPRR